ncbi:MAG: thiamine diphosphokinase [Candidatus Marinimicrobia bacterium]|nr:thiamine diphosphokinase [Candidatus Neomarinimicrobiota bacterium]
MKKKALLILNGKLENREMIQKIGNSSDLIIATDGAYDKIIKFNFTPNIVIGDLDSIKKMPTDVKIIEVEDQNKSDFEKAIEWLIINEYSEVSIVGITGGRLDHLLINFAIVYKYLDKINLTIYSNSEKLIFLQSGHYSIYGENGDLFSIIALPQVEDLEIENAKYSVNEKVFSIGSRGLSNEFISDEIKISFSSGILVFIQSNK